MLAVVAVGQLTKNNSAAEEFDRVNMIQQLVDFVARRNVEGERDTNGERDEHAGTFACLFVAGMKRIDSHNLSLSVNTQGLSWKQPSG
jgi:hypothetical protein